MEMLQCRFILASLLVLNGCFLEVSCEIVTYTTKDTESLPCTITEQTTVVAWTDVSLVGNPITVLEYQSGNDPPFSISKEEKYTNFNYTLEPTSLNLVIENVEDEDGGRYLCSPFGLTAVSVDVTVEVLVKPTVQYESQDVDVLNVTVGISYDLTCSATEARSVSELSLMWDPSLVEKTLGSTPNGDYMDYSITSTYTATKGDSSITCQLTGYDMQAEINDQRMELISHTVNLNVQYAPMCGLVIQEGEDCREVTLTCNCDAIPVEITLYSFFNGSSLMHNGTINTFTVSVAFGTSTEFSCSATNDLGPGNQTDPTVHNCDEGTTALPTTTIVTTAPLSTNEPTSTKAMETTTEEPITKGDDDPDPFPIWVIILIIVVVLAVVIAVIAVIMYKKGKCGSNSSSANSGKGIENDGMDPPTDYAEVKMKSDKLDDNGAGPRGDPEIPAYGVVDKNRTKDPTPAPRSSMRDSKNPSNPKQDGLMEMQYADLDHGNKPPSDEVRKPKEEPTEYATVQSVIV